MTAVVIPVRPGDTNPELVYALRSIHAHVTDPDIWIIGHKPSWLTGVHHIPTRPRGRKSDRGTQQARAAATHPDIPEWFWWWDDDDYRLRPLPEPRNHHGGKVNHWLQRKYRNLNSNYATTLRRTADILDDDALFWDLHIPFWIPSKADLADTMSQLPDGVGGWLWRTVHGNRVNLPGDFHVDVKVYRDDPVIPDAWLSSDNASWPRVKPNLTGLFPTPSPWESRPAEPTQTLTTYRRGDQIRRLPYHPSRDTRLRHRGWQTITA